MGGLLTLGPKFEPLLVPPFLLVDLRCPPPLFKNPGPAPDYRPIRLYHVNSLTAKTFYALPYVLHYRLPLRMSLVNPKVHTRRNVSSSAHSNASREARTCAT